MNGLGLKRQKAVLIVNGNPLFGEIGQVKIDDKTGKVFVTLVTPIGETKPIDVKSKLESDEFRILSDEDVQSLISRKKDHLDEKSALEMITRVNEVNEEPRFQLEPQLKGVKVGGIVETMVLSGRYRGIWVKAKVLKLWDGTIDLKVLYPKKWKVSAFALGVPQKLIRKVAKEDRNGFVVPIEFMVDDSILYLGCNRAMRIQHLKVTVSKEKGFSKEQLYFMCNGEWLSESDSIPNEVIYCIVHKKGKLSPTQIGLVRSNGLPTPPTSAKRKGLKAPT